MSTRDGYSGVWYRWLVVVTVGLMVFGLAMVVAPGSVRQVFSLMFYSSTDRIEAFGDEPAKYVEFAHAVMGAVMLGWGMALLLVLRGPFRREPREGCAILAVSLTVWFVADTAFSLWSGFWENAVLNTALAALFAIPLAAIWRRTLGAESVAAGE